MSQDQIRATLAPLAAKLATRERKNALARDRRRTSKLAAAGVVVVRTALRVVR